MRCKKRQVLLVCYVLVVILLSADVNATTVEFLETPLLLAAYYPAVETVKILLENGADITLCDKEETSAVMIAAAHNNVQVLEVRLH